MRSYPIIFTACAGLYVVHWTSDVFPGGVIPLAFGASFLIMDLLGFFTRENKAAKVATKSSPQEETRAEKFKRQVLEGKPDDADAIIRILDEDGGESAIIIKSTGEITTEGNPPADIIKVAEDLRGSIKQFGVDSIAQQIQQALQKLNEQNEKDSE